MRLCFRHSEKGQLDDIPEDADRLSCAVSVITESVVVQIVFLFLLRQIKVPDGIGEKRSSAMMPIFRSVP